MLRAARPCWLAFSIAALISASSATLADSGAFSHFAGSFRGTGEVQLSDGHRERIACRANDVIGGGGRTMSQNIVCASDSYKFDIRGQLVAAGTEVSCDWQEMTRGVSGAITGRISDDVSTGLSTPPASRRPSPFAWPDGIWRSACVRTAAMSFASMSHCRAD